MKGIAHTMDPRSRRVGVMLLIGLAVLGLGLQAGAISLFGGGGGGADKAVAKASKALEQAEAGLRAAEARAATVREAYAKAQEAVRVQTAGIGKVSDKRSWKQAVADLSAAKAREKDLAVDVREADGAVTRALADVQRKRAALAELQGGVVAAPAVVEYTPAVVETTPAAVEVAAPAAEVAAPVAEVPAVVTTVSEAPAEVRTVEAEAPRSETKWPRLGLPAVFTAKADEPKTVSAPIDWVEKQQEELPPGLVLDKEIRPSPQPQVAFEPGPDPTVTTQFDAAMVSGDKDIVESLQIWKDWAYRVAFTPVSDADIQAFGAQLTQALQEQGYVFAKVDFPRRVWPMGIFLAKVDCGPLGSVTVSGNKYYSASQIVANLGERQDEGRFNYARFYQDLYDLNAKPDVTVNTKLKPIIQDGRRVVNAELEVEDKLPIHGAIELSNSGTYHTNDWRIQTTLQHVNLTKHDDVLTVDWITSFDLSDVNAFSAGYFLPFNRDYSLNLFGGISDSDIDDVLPQMDIRGEGYFAGAQLTRTLMEDDKKRVQLSGGWLWQNLEQENDVGGVQIEQRDVTLSMPTLTLGYASRVFDRFNGRNFASNTILANFAGRFGSSDEEDFDGLADGSFVVDRFQLARYQRLFCGPDAPGKFTMFLKVDGQVASEALYSSVRKAVGGADSVRGYREQDVSGDDGVTASIEVRTPLWENFIPGLKLEEGADSEAWQQHRLQLLAFADYGYVRMKDPLPGEFDSDDLFGVGVGTRLTLTKYAQMRLDVGFPLSHTEETTSSARAHFSLQLQF